MNIKNEIVTISCKCGFLKNVTEQNKEVHNPNTGGIIMKTHELKIWPEYFKAVKNGTKTFELRKNDRDFKVGDILVLKEWKPGLIDSTGPEEIVIEEQGYTGRKIEKKISFILNGGQFITKGSGLRKGWVILGII